MTRAPGSETRLDYTTFGGSGGGRVVVLLREEGGSAVDPNVHITSQHDVRILAILLLRDEVSDPGAYGGETPGSTTVTALAALVNEQVSDPDASIGLIGIAGAGEESILLANRLGAGVDRLVLVGVPKEDSPLERHLAEQIMSGVSAKTLVLNGEKDPDASADAASWHRDHIPDARVEMVPGDAYGPDPRLSISDVWERALSHTAPGAARR